MFILATSIVRNPLSTTPAFGRALNECLLGMVVLSILYSHWNEACVSRRHTTPLSLEEGVLEREQCLLLLVDM